MRSSDATSLLDKNFCDTAEIILNGNAFTFHKDS